MSREIAPDDPREPERPAARPEVSLSRGEASRARVPRDPRSETATAFRLPVGMHREPVSLGSQVYRLRHSEVATLTAVGTFRSLFTRDLAHYSDSATRQVDVQSLRVQRLIDRRTLHVKGEAAAVEVLSLTQAGKRLLEAHRTTRDGTTLDQADVQRLYAGWVRIREMHHDSALYGMAQAERNRIEAAGGTVRRIVLGDELTAQVYRSVKHDGDGGCPTWAAQRDAVAAASDLTVVDGHVQFPDVRVEYETAAGDRAHVDLELVTEHYGRADLSVKQAAGFRLYRLGGRGSHLARATPGEARRRRGSI